MYGKANKPCQPQTVSRYVDVLKYLELITEQDGYLKPLQTLLSFSTVSKKFKDALRTEVNQTLKTKGMDAATIRRLSTRMLQDNPPVLPTRDNIKERLKNPRPGDDPTAKFDMPESYFDPCFSILWRTDALDRQVGFIYK